MLDNGVGKHALTVAFPSIKYNKKIHVQRLMDPITKEKMIKEREDQLINRINPDTQQRSPAIQPI